MSQWASGSKVVGVILEMYPNSAFDDGARVWFYQRGDVRDLFWPTDQLHKLEVISEGG
jgi:hypothetical protein